jgi:hypothetical protein
MSTDQVNALREQQLINARILSVDKAVAITAKSSSYVPVDEVLKDAQKIMDYLLKDITALDKPSAIIKQVNMPPAGAFRPGE